MAKGTCTIEGCDRKSFAKGWCSAHYNRWRRNGDPGGADVQARRTGCKVEGCDAKHQGQGYCQTHRYRWRSNGDPLVTRPPGAPAGESHSHYRGQDVRYAAVHRRLSKYRGRARDLDCINCGSVADAWAYQFGAPDERICEKAGLPYSTDLSYYQPMCRPCHSQFDALRGWEQPTYFGRGTSFLKRGGRWRAYATLDGKQYNGGRYDSQEEAARAAEMLRSRLLTDWQKAPH